MSIPWANYSYINPDIDAEMHSASMDYSSSMSVAAPPSRQSYWTGEKFMGGFGMTEIYDVDYATLRERSAQLFRSNIYARGLVRRLVTNEINAGLTPESTPQESILGYEYGELSDWSEDVEARFKLYSDNPRVCDYSGRLTYSELQYVRRMDALISGDILVMLHISKITGLPQIQLVDGSRVQTPLDSPRLGNEIKHGVELNKRGNHVAYWVVQSDGTSIRVPARGPKSNRRIAWLSYGIGRRIDEVRGEPLLGVVLQSLREIDRYRDSTQRKATINSILAMFIKKDEDKMGTLPISGAAVRRSEIATDTPDVQRRFNLAEYLPGTVIDELQTGETPVSFGHDGTDIRFKEFEQAIIYAIAWACEIPPEILTLAFSSNYSASQAATNEFKIYLNKERSHIASGFDKPIYEEWFLSSVLRGDISAPGFVESWGKLDRYQTYGAWVSSDWCGAIKPSVDPVKQVNAYKIMLAHGLVTYDKAAREMTGTKWTSNMRRLMKEREMLEELGMLGIKGDDEDGSDSNSDTDSAMDEDSD